MIRTSAHIVAGLTLLCGFAAPLPAAELLDRVPADTILYIGWPGASAFREHAKDTSWEKFLQEPQVIRFREHWNQQVWPAIDQRIRKELAVEDRDTTEIYAHLLELTAAAWKHPSALVFVGASPDGPSVDMALLIRAEDEAERVAGRIGDLFELIASASDGEKPQEFKVGDDTLRGYVTEDGPPLRYGMIGRDVVLVTGDRLIEHWTRGNAAEGLSSSPRFAAAAKATGASPATPVAYLDFKETVATIERFQPAMASLDIPILGEPGGLSGILGKLGLDKLNSITLAMQPHAGGFKTAGFVHAPGIGSGSGLFGQKPLTDDDIRQAPEKVYWASIDNVEIAGFYDYLLGSFEAISPKYHQQAMPYLREFEEKTGVNIRDDLLASFGDTWILFDSPENVGLWLTGLTVMAELRPDNRLEHSLGKIVEAIDGITGDQYPIRIEEETYREQKISYVRIPNIPIPIAPAWTIHEGRWIFALYPQVLYPTLDFRLDGGPSLLENRDFQRGRALMPAGFSSIGYADPVMGVRQLYSMLMPMAPIAVGLLQAEGIPLDAGLLPPARTVTRHLFGTVAVNVTTEDGVLSVSHGAFPIPTPAGSSTGAGLGAMTPFMMMGMEQSETYEAEAIPE